MKLIETILINEIKNNNYKEFQLEITQILDKFKNLNQGLIIISCFSLFDPSFTLNLISIDQVIFTQLMTIAKSKNSNNVLTILKIMINLSSNREIRHQISNYFMIQGQDLLEIFKETHLSQSLLLIAKLSTTPIFTTLSDHISLDLFMSVHDEIITESLCYLTVHYIFKQKALEVIQNILKIQNISHLTKILKNLSLSNDELWIYHDEEKEISFKEAKSLQDVYRNILPNQDIYDHGAQDSILIVKNALNENNAQVVLLNL